MPRVKKRQQKSHRNRFRLVTLGLCSVLVVLPVISAMAETFVGLQDPRTVAVTGSVSALSDTTVPGAVSNLASADSFNPALTPPCGPVALYPTINAMSISVTTPVSGTDHATIRYRTTGATSWTAGHDAVLTNTGHVDGSLFWLTAGTGYDVEVTSRAANGTALTVNQCAAATQPELQASAVTRTLYVSAAAAPGGTGTRGHPYTTVQAAATVAQPGDQIVVQPGVYRERVTFPRSGQPGAFIKVVGQPGAIFDGSDPTIEQNGLVWTPDGSHPNVYTATLPVGFYNDWFLINDPIWRDTKIFYIYDDLASLQSGTGHNSVPISEGWHFNVTTHTLTVRSLTNPATHTWHVRSNNVAFQLQSRSYIWIEGLNFRYYPMGIYIPSGTHNVIRSSTFQSETGVLIDNSQGTTAEANRIESSTFLNPDLADWGYLAVKGTAMESGAIVAWQGTGNIFRDNRIEQHFNGIFTGDSYDTDVYRNVIRHLGDDGIETDGIAENVRVWGNAVDDINSALSLAPTTVGPVWAIYNRFTQFIGRAFKIGGGVSGTDFFYHNTVYSTTADGFGTQQVTTDTNRLVFRNNIIQTNHHAVRWTEAMPGVDMDHDNLYSTYSPPYVWQHLTEPFPYNYYHVAEICVGEGQECHGSEALPKLVNPSGGSFGLQSSSPNIDTAIPIPGINHIFTGAGPDRGYLEYGQPEITW